MAEMEEIDPAGPEAGAEAAGLTKTKKQKKEKFKRAVVVVVSSIRKWLKK